MLDGDGRFSAGRPSQFKAKATRESEVARRRAALSDQQQEARAARLADVRRVAMDALLGGSAVNDFEAEVEIEESDDEELADAGDAMDADASMPKAAATKKTSRLRKLQRTLFFARQFQVPDWMVDVPSDLSSSWLLQTRPEGDRCLLLSEGGKVEVRRKNGFVLERYTDSRLPAGLTILDVVCVEEELPAAGAVSSSAPVSEGNKADCTGMVEDAEDGDETGAVDDDAMADVVASGGGGATSSGRGGRGYGNKGKGRGKSGRGRGGGRPPRPMGARKYAVMDVLFWADQDFCAAEAECRMFWLDSRFSELPDKWPRRARQLQLIPASAATPEALHKAYHEDVGYVKDSLAFQHREGHYWQCEAVTPLALQWRDRKLSRWVVDTPDAKGEALPDRQAVVLELRGGGHLRTAERLVVHQLKSGSAEMAAVQELVKGVKGGKPLLRCEVESVDLVGRQVGGLRVQSYVPARSRIWPDSWGRIAFQDLNRKGGEALTHLTFEVLMAAAAGTPPPAG